MNVLYRLQRFMYGRNGVDRLTAFLLLAGLGLYIVSRLTRIWWLGLVYDAVLVYCLYRTFSKNLYKRQRENQAFMQKANAATAWLRLRVRMLREAKTHRYLKCPACKQRLRVPRGKGKIEIRCSKCQNRFIKKV